MGYKVKQLKNYTASQIETLFESNGNNIIGVKLYAIIQLTRGYSTHKLEEIYRVTHKQICNWADRFDAESIAGLRMKQGRGRYSLVSREQKEELKKRFISKS
jgi:transposase